MKFLTKALFKEGVMFEKISNLACSLFEKLSDVYQYGFSFAAILICFVAVPIVLVVFVCSIFFKLIAP